MILAFVLGVAFGWLIFNSQTIQGTISCRSDYKFINPEPDCEISESENLKNINNSLGSVDEFINNYNVSRPNTRISVFFRDLITRRWFGVNDKEKYIAGSLAKLPLAMAYFKLSEIDNTLLSQKLAYRGHNEESSKENIKINAGLKYGKSYSIEDLLERMIKYSDNDALLLLASKIDPKFIVGVYKDFNISIDTEDNVNRGLVSVYDYSSILRSLYNSSYLTRAESEKILNILSTSDFKDGLVSGIPSGATIAHKFGENSGQGSDGNILWRTLHDCGIIYKPDHPYILCVATMGYDLEELKYIISNVSKIVYEQIR